MNYDKLIYNLKNVTNKLEKEVSITPIEVLHLNDILQTAIIALTELTYIRHSFWDESGHYRICSNCKKKFSRYDEDGHLQDFIYCPACGAKMDLNILLRENE